MNYSRALGPMDRKERGNGAPETTNPGRERIVSYAVGSDPCLSYPQKYRLSS